jgi:hypothetical protein
MKRLPLAIVLTAFALVPAKADTIARWTFETSNPFGAFPPGTWFTNIVPEVGHGTASALHLDWGIYYGVSTGNGSSRAFCCASNWAVGDFYQFAVNTTGYSDIQISYDQTGERTGPRDFVLQYSLNGTTFASLMSYSVVSNGFNGHFWNSSTYYPEYSLSFDLSSITAIDNSPIVYFRVTDNSTTAIDGGIVSLGSQMDSLDNFTVTASPIPEPSALCLMGVTGLIPVLMERRRRLLFPVISGRVWRQLFP